MAHSSIGTHPSHGHTKIVSLSSAEQLGSRDSGLVFMCTHSSAFTVNLPKLSTEIAGWQARFITKASGADMHIMAWGLTSAGGTGDSGVTNDGDTVTVSYTHLTLPTIYSV